MAADLREIAKLFLKLGTIGFGGPATHIALMEEEVVERRQWMSRQEMLDLIGATNLIPGPNSTELAIHIGYQQAGWRGLIVAGICFIFPAVLITTLFAWMYVRLGQTPHLTPMIAGIKPAVLAIIFSAGWKLGRKAIRGWLVAIIAIAVTVASSLGVSEVLALLSGGLLGMLLLRESADKPTQINGNASLGLAMSGAARGTAGASMLALTSVAANSASLFKLAVFFLKVGAVLYGTGYVLIAYLQGGLVDDYGWLTDDQLLDAIAIGQFTPGPILSTATFVGYVVMANEHGHASGIAGAVVATAAIFIPSFLLVAISGPFVPKMRGSRWMAAFLDSVNAASMGLMAAVTFRLAWRLFFPTGILAEFSWQSILIAIGAALCVILWKVGSIWIVIGGAVVGYAFSIIATG